MRRLRLSLIGVVLLALALPWVWTSPARAMILLDATTASLEVVLGGAVTTNQLPFTVSFADHTSSAFTPDQNNGTTNSTTAVTLVSAPAASTQRQVKFLSIYNADTVSADVTVRYNDNGTTRNIVVISLAVGSTLEYSDGHGFRVIASSGQIQTGGGAPDSATYWVGTSSTALSAEHILANLATGLVQNTTGTGTPSAYAGTSCGNAFIRSLNAAALAGCYQVDLAADVTGKLPFANLTNLAGLSVLGVTANSTGETAAITAGTDGHVLRRSGTSLGFGTIDHGTSLTGLTDDDHTQYGLLAGRSGGQTFTAGAGSGDDFTFRTTTNATKGTFFFEQGDALELASGTTAMQLRLREPSAGGTAYVSFAAPALAANTVYTLPTDDGDADQVLSTNGSGTLDWVAGGASAPPSVQVFTASGTWTKPAGVTRVIVEVVGGGGGGGGTAITGSGQVAAAAGGGGGGYARMLIDVSAISTSTITIGASGAGGSAGANAGSAGGTSSWNDGTTTVSATGGAGGEGGTLDNPREGGAGGLGSGGDINAPGGDGGSTSVAAGVVYQMSFGGASVLTGSRTAVNNNTAGRDGRGYGGGGSGATALQNQAAGKAGGSGSAGVVIVLEFQ